MRSVGRLIAMIVVTVGFAWSGIALASDCPSPGVDCENTSGHDSGVSIVGAVVAVGAGLLGKSLADSRKTPPSR